tara:strand:+ start:58 stop:657 length:600 start_codon:yes stop_codon:yes gene_type:complete
MMVGDGMPLRLVPLVLVLLLLTAIAGCTSEVTDSQPNGSSIHDSDLTGIVITNQSMIPAFNLTSHDDIIYSSQNLIGTSYVLYFSAQWCSHCHPTLNALDNVIPETRLIIIGKDARPEYEDMEQWKYDIEQDLNRTLNRPFCLGPEVAEANGVTGIPFFRMVNETGVIMFEHEGMFTDEAEINRQWNATWFGSPSNESG